MADEPTRRVKQVIVLRTSYPDGRGGTFKPRLGKLAAQAAHASMKVFFDAKFRAHGIPEADMRVLAIPLTKQMAEWVDGTFTKVVLGVETEEELLRVHDLALKGGIPTALITDVGATEFHGVPTNTAVAVGPDYADVIDAITGKEGLVPTRLL